MTATAAPIAPAYDECRRIARTSRSSFYAGMRLLPPERRDAIFAVYALARRIDDIADGTAAADEKLAQLDAVRAQLAVIDETDDPVLAAVADAAARFPIPLDAFDDLLDGAQADVRLTRYATFAELERYCRCVAGSIGRLALGVFFVSNRAAAEPLADDLGTGLQLGNILRDLGDDLRQGRLYLPAEDLERFGCRVRNGQLEGGAQLLVAFEAERALARLRRGLELLPLVDRRSASCICAMAGSYRLLVERIARDPAIALRGQRVSLRRVEKWWVVSRSLATLGGAGAA